jgi:hypothetical protein
MKETLLVYRKYQLKQGAKEMKQFALLALLFFSITALSGQGVPSLVLDAGSNDSTAIDKAIKANWQNTLTQQYYSILEMDKEKVYAEFHIGIAGDAFMGNAWGNYPSDGGTLGQNISGASTVLLKFNLTNPKRPYADRIIDRIEYVKELEIQTGVKLSPAAWTELNSVNTEMIHYDSSDIYKRFSLGFGLPAGISIAQSSVYGSPSTMIDNPFNFSTSLSDLFVFAGYDLGDMFTLEVGPNVYANRLFIGVSIDLSTPILHIGGFARSSVSSYIGASNMTTNMSPSIVN